MYTENQLNQRIEALREYIRNHSVSRTDHVPRHREALKQIWEQGLALARDDTEQAADKIDINVALLDETLRAYRENKLEEKEFLPAEEEK